MKFTLPWLKDHLETSLTTAQIADAMTMAGLEVEHVSDPAAKLAAFTVAKIISAERHPNADRLQVCQVDTIDGAKEIVCGAPNARPGLTTIYAPIGAYVPGLGVTLVEKPVRGVVSMGMLCSAAELEAASDSAGIVELPDSLAVGTPAAEALSMPPVIDFEVTPNRPDWLGVSGIARDLAAAGAGKFLDQPIEAVPGKFPCPVKLKVDGDACHIFAGRLIRGVKNGPSPQWLQDRLRAVGLRPISALVDITNLVTLDRARPLHVYDHALLVGDAIEARLGHHAPHGDEQLIALDGKTYDLTAEMSVISDAGGERPIGLGGVMGGQSTGCSETTTDAFVESAWFDPIRTAQTGRATGISSDAQYRFARGVDPQSCVPGLELATKLILELCGGEPSEIVVAGQAPAPPPAVDFDPSYVKALAGLDLPYGRALEILAALGFDIQGAKVWPPSWRRDVQGKADLVEEVARIEGFAALPSTPLPEVPPAPNGILNPLQARVRTARRALAAAGFHEALTWSFTKRDTARLFGGGSDELVLANPIAAELDCMRPSILPNLIEAAGRNANRGFSDAALFEIGPVYLSDGPADQRTSIAAVVAAHPPRHWGGSAPDPLMTLKGDLFALLEELGANVGAMQIAQGAAGAWWHPGRSAALQLGPKTTLATFGEIHPAVLKALDVAGPLYGFEIILDSLPAPKRRSVKTKSAFDGSALMPLSRDFAFLTDRAKPAGDLARAAAGADKALIAGVRVFDIYEGKGVPEGEKSVALEVQIQPRDHTLTDVEIEALADAVVTAVSKAGGRLRA
jgi:phenylalanyl-tRNA synthetase beta chain